jgi:hypothetical protein
LFYQDARRRELLCGIARRHLFARGMGGVPAGEAEEEERHMRKRNEHTVKAKGRFYWGGRQEKSGGGVSGNPKNRTPSIVPENGNNHDIRRGAVTPHFAQRLACFHKMQPGFPPGGR